MAWSSDELVQRGHNFAIVDEVDSILIDEARTPLIISGPAEQSARWYGEFAAVVARLQRGKDGEGDYEVDEAKRTVAVTERGVARVEDRLGIDNLYESVNTPLVGYLNNAHQGQGALQARQGLHRQRRRGPDRRRVHRPHPARPPLQRGHAPGHRGQGGRRDQAGEPDPRHDHPAELLPPLRQALRHDRYGADRGRRVQQGLQASAWCTHPDAPADDPRRPVRTSSTRPRRPSSTRSSRTSPSGTRPGQPVLVGTVSVENSEILSQLLRRRGIPHAVLNAKYHAKEAEIIAQAGRKGGGHRRHQHGRPRHRHPARRQPRVPGRGRAAPARPRPGRARRRSTPRRSRRSCPRWKKAVRRRRPTRSSTPAGSTCSAPSGTSRAASTTSCAAAPAGRATRASRGSTCRCRTS